MTIAIGHIKDQHDIARISRAAGVNITSTRDRARQSYLVTARTQADADAFTAAAERIGLGDAIS